MNESVCGEQRDGHAESELGWIPSTREQATHERKHAQGKEHQGYRQLLEAWDPKRVAEVTGVAEEDQQRIAEEMVQFKPALVMGEVSRRSNVRIFFSSARSFMVSAGTVKISIRFR